MRPHPNPLRSVAAGLFIMSLALPCFFSSTQGTRFLPLLYFTLAATTLLGSLSTFQPRGVSSGRHGADELAGIGLCILIGFWPLMLLPVGVTGVPVFRHPPHGPGREQSCLEEEGK